MLLILLFPCILARNLNNGYGTSVNNTAITSTSLPSTFRNQPALASDLPSASSTPTPYASSNQTPYASSNPTPYASSNPTPYASSNPTPYASNNSTPYVSSNPMPYESSTHSPSFTSAADVVLSPYHSDSHSQTQTQSQKPVSPNSTVSSAAAAANSKTSIYDTDTFKIATGIGVGTLIVLLILANIFCVGQNLPLSAKPQLQLQPVKPLHSSITVNPLKTQNLSITENGITYYYDGNTGKLLADGWQRFQDTNGDVWYTNSKGLEPSWTPVYK